MHVDRHGEAKSVRILSSQTVSFSNKSHAQLTWCTSYYKESGPIGCRSWNRSPMMTKYRFLRPFIQSETEHALKAQEQGATRLTKEVDELRALLDEKVQREKGMLLTIRADNGAAN